MIRQMCGVKPNEVSQVRSQDLPKKLRLLDLKTVLREEKVYGHVMRQMVH